MTAARKIAMTDDVAPLLNLRAVPRDPTAWCARCGAYVGATWAGQTRMRVSKPHPVFCESCVADLEVAREREEAGRV